MNHATDTTASTTTSKIDKQPAYKRIQAYILECIEKEQLKPGEQISTEMELAEQFGVSRMTVNKAIVGLSEQNVLTRIAGKGTFVSKPKKELPLMQTVDFAEEVRQRGGKYKAVVIEHQVKNVFEDIATHLGVINGATAGYCKVVHYENSTPIISESRYVNLDHIDEDNFLSPDFTQITPTEYLLKQFPLTEIEHTVEAILPSAIEQNELQLDKHSPCLKVFRRTWSNSVLISYAELVTVGHAYRLRSRYCF